MSGVVGAVGAVGAVRAVRGFSRCLEAPRGPQTTAIPAQVPWRCLVVVCACVWCVSVRVGSVGPVGAVGPVGTVGAVGAVRAVLLTIVGLELAGTIA